MKLKCDSLTLKKRLSLEGCGATSGLAFQYYSHLRGATMVGTERENFEHLELLNCRKEPFHMQS
jgi:hypothetical protein